MNSIRIHSSATASQGSYAYLLVSYAGSDRVILNFSQLPELATFDLPNLALSQQALSEILAGRDIVVDTSFMTVGLFPRGLELVITSYSTAHGPSGASRVWLSELALGWNILCHGVGNPA